MLLSYDDQGRALVNLQVGNFYNVTNATIVIGEGMTITFGDAGSNIRFKNGKLQIFDETGMTWHNVRCDQANGARTIFTDDAGEA